MQSAAGGTSQRLKPAVAMVRSLSRNPPPAPDMLPALLIVVIVSSPNSMPLLGMSAVHDPVILSPSLGSFPRRRVHLSRCARIAERIREFQHPMQTDMPA